MQNSLSRKSGKVIRPKVLSNSVFAVRFARNDRAKEWRLLEMTKAGLV